MQYSKCATYERNGLRRWRYADSVGANNFTASSRRNRSECLMVNAIRYELNRTVDHGEIYAARVRAAKSAHVPPACTSGWLTGSCETRSGSAPIKIDLYASDRPVSLARPSSAILVDWGRFPDQKCLASPISDFTHLNATAMIGKSPKNAEAVDRKVAIKLLRWKTRASTPVAGRIIKRRLVIASLERRVCGIPFVAGDRNQPRRICNLGRI